MKKSNLIKGILLIVLSIALIGTNAVYAASFEDELDNISATSSNKIDEDDEPANLTPANTNKTPENTNKTPANTNVSNTNNSSVYTNKTNTNSSLPKTGIGDSLPTIVLVVLFTISAVYAYKKISDYKNV